MSLPGVVVPSCLNDLTDGANFDWFSPHTFVPFGGSEQRPLRSFVECPHPLPRRCPARPTRINPLLLGKCFCVPSDSSVNANPIRGLIIRSCVSLRRVDVHNRARTFVLGGGGGGGRGKRANCDSQWCRARGYIVIAPREIWCAFSNLLAASSFGLVFFGMRGPLMFPIYILSDAIETCDPPVLEGLPNSGMRPMRFAISRLALK